jgi:hypothetical protein
MAGPGVYVVLLCFVPCLGMLDGLELRWRLVRGWYVDARYFYSSVTGRKVQMG